MKLTLIHQCGSSQTVFSLGHHESINECSSSSNLEPLFAAKFFISLSEKNVIIRRIIGTAAVVSSASRRKTRASTPRSGAAPRSHLVGAPLGLRGSNLVNSGGAASSPTRRAQKSICSPLCWTITTNTGYPRIHNCRMSSPLTRMVRKLS